MDAIRLFPTPPFPCSAMWIDVLPLPLPFDFVICFLPSIHHRSLTVRSQPMKTGSVLFQPFQICERIVAITVQDGPFLKLLALRGSPFPSPVAWRGCAGFLAGPTNYRVEGFVAYLETIARERLPQFLPRPSGSQSEFNFRQKHVHRCRLPTRSGGEKFLERCAAAI